MQEPFQIFDYIGYLAARWRVFAVACAAAGVLTLGVSLLLPKQYTATASMLIEPPLGVDPRVSTAVTPVYLESLKTYEHFAESDTLFLEALNKFNLRAEYPSAAPESLRRRVLNVIKPRDTKILQISATLRDPVKAQGLAQYIAQRTVELNAALGRQSEQELADEARRQLKEATDRVREAEKATNEMLAREPYQAAQDEVDSLGELRTRVQKAILDSQVDAADYAAQSRPQDVASVRARIAILEKQAANIEAELAVKEKIAAERHARWDQLEASLNSARQQARAAENRMNELRFSSGASGERLRVIDPGIVPQRPSVPNIPLNVVVAVFVAAIVAWLYITVAFNLRAHRRSVPARAFTAER